VLTNRKAEERKRKVQLIDARQFFVKMKKSLGNKRNKIGEKDEGEPDHIGEITRIYGAFRDGETRLIGTNGDEKSVVVSKIFDNEDFGYQKITVERPLRLNLQATPERIERIVNETAFQNLATSKKKDGEMRLKEIGAGKQRQQEIRALLEAFAESSGGKCYKDRIAFLRDLRAMDRRKGVRLTAAELKAVLSALGERDETAEICRDSKGNPEPDADLRDTESVPLKESIEEYVAREVLPHVPDAWIDEKKTKVGYEIPLTRHFYQYEPPRPLEEIDAEIKALEGEILALLKEVAE